MASRERTRMSLVSYNDVTIHPSVDDSLKDRLTVVSFGFWSSVTEV